MRKNPINLLAIFILTICALFLFAACDGQAVQIASVTYYINGDIPLKTVEVNKGEKLIAPQNPVRDGYSFVTWKNAADNSEWNFEQDTVKGNTFIYAEWKAVEKPKFYTVTFDYRGDMPVEFVSVRHGEKLIAPQNPVREGYNFVTWKNAADGNVWDFDRDSVLFDTVLYAVWEELPRFTVVYRYVNDKDDVRWFKTTKGGKLEAPAAPVKDGYVFIGWRNNKTNLKWDFDTDVVNDNLLLVAEWEKAPAKEFMVTVYFDGMYNWVTTTSDKVWTAEELVTVIYGGMVDGEEFLASNDVVWKLNGKEFEFGPEGYKFSENDGISGTVVRNEEEI